MKGKMKHVSRVAGVAALTWLFLLGSRQAQAGDDSWKLCKGTDADAAITACSPLIGSKKAPDHARAPLYRGVAYERKMLYDRAIGDFDRAIEVNPNYAVALNERGVAYAQKGEYDRAILDFSRCWARVMLNQPAEALIDCNRSLTLQPNDPATLDSRGFAYLRLGRMATAIEDFNAALALDPKLATSLYGRGLAKRLSGDAEGGDADISTAAQLQPGIVADFTRRGFPVR